VSRPMANLAQRLSKMAQSRGSLLLRARLNADRFSQTNSIRRETLERRGNNWDRSAQKRSKGNSFRPFADSNESRATIEEHRSLKTDMRKGSVAG
jgi:hypothetical protein